MFYYGLGAIVLVTVAAFAAGRHRGSGFAGSGIKLHSLPSYHGLYTAAAALIKSERCRMSDTA